MKKQVIVFGAGGSIGTKIVFDLIQGGYQVVTPTRSCDVADRDILDDYLKFRIGHYNDGFDSVIYAIGHCPDGGFMEAVGTPLSQLPLETYKREIGMHQVGVLNVFQTMLPNLVDGGNMLFLSSAITRMKGKFPPHIHADPHASVISAEDWLIDGMRHDTEVIRRNIKIHRIAPSAVDTPFHEKGQTPVPLIPIEVVVKAVVDAIGGDEEVDRQILPEPKE